MRSFIAILLSAVLFLPSCARKTPIGKSDDVCLSRGSIRVYKTKKDYTNNVCVQLSADKKSLVSYPGHTDVHLPILLADGYYLQTTVGNAYLSIRLDEYTNTDSTYPFSQLINYVIDNDPFTEIYECCSCTTRDTTQLNALIRNGQLGKCGK